MDMTQGPLWRMIIVYTVPIIMTGLLQLLFMAVDLIIAGRFCGKRVSGLRLGSGEVFGGFSGLCFFGGGGPS